MAEVDTMEFNNRVNWDAFDSHFVKLENDVKKKLVLSTWRNGEAKFDEDKAPKPALVFDVLSEDGKPVTKEFKATSTLLINKLKPICIKADDNRQGEIVVSITKVGKGTGTQYVVEEHQ